MVPLVGGIQEIASGSVRDRQRNVQRRGDRLVGANVKSKPIPFFESRRVAHNSYGRLGSDGALVVVVGFYRYREDAAVADYRVSVAIHKRQNHRLVLFLRAVVVNSNIYVAELRQGKNLHFRVIDIREPRNAKIPVSREIVRVGVEGRRTGHGIADVKIGSLVRVI